MKKYLVVEVDVRTPNGGYDIEENDIEVEVNTKQFTIEELLRHTDFRWQLLNNGWVDTTKISELNLTNVGPRAFVLNMSRNHVSGILIDSGSLDVIESYAFRNSFVAVEIGLEVLKKYNPELHDLLKKRIEADKRAEIAAAKRRQKLEEKQKLLKDSRETRKIEAAKKLLEKAGLTITTKK